MDFQFRPYEAADRERCLALFDANCPAYFAANERHALLSRADGRHLGTVEDTGPGHRTLTDTPAKHHPVAK